MTEAEHAKPKFAFAVDSTFAGWQLAQLGPDSVRAVRNLDAEESDRLNRAVYTLRDHIKGQPTRLLVSAEAMLVQAIEALPVPGDTPDGGPEVLDLIALPMVSWLLMWRLQRENLTADVRTKLRDQPERCKDFERIKRDVFDTNPSYRLAEGLRDYVQHYASPPITIQRGARRKLDGATERFNRVTVHIEPLREWGGLKAPLRRDLVALSTGPDLRTMISEAMAGMAAVTQGYERIVAGVLGDAISELRAVLAETAPFGATFVQIIRNGNDLQIRLAPASDVFAWLVGQPNPNLARNLGSRRERE
jgi:hypothetical protein